MKTVGMIGGVSFESTQLYYKLINETVRSRLGGINSAQLMVASLNYQPIIDHEYRHEWDQVGTILANAAVKLEDAKVDFIVLCCNTLHKVASHIESKIQIPFIHITDAAGIALQKQNIRHIGLLGTKVTMEDGFYTQRLAEKFNINVSIPDPASNAQLDKIILEELCAGIFLERSKQFLLQCMHNLTKQGAEAILLGCTEFGILVQQNDFHLPVFDTTLLHVEETCTQIFK